MEKKWYVLQALSGQEGKVRENLEKRILQEEMQEYVGQVLVPTEKVSELKPGGKKTTVVRKFFPGYVLIELALYDEEGQVMEKPWVYIQSTPGLIGFVSSDRNRPQPMRQSEVDQMMAQIQNQNGDTTKFNVKFEPGERVKVTDGAFMGQSGLVEEVDPDHGRLKVSVLIFDREVPVDLEYWQVERAED
jgi:transcriptional antiterminator NusG